MSYRIEKGESLEEAFGRIAAEEMDLANTQLARRNGGEAIHNARKALKRLRALMRSLRVAFPEKLFRTENKRLAAAGRKISPIRDVHVQLRALDRLRIGRSPARDRVQRQLRRRQSSFTRRIPALRATVREMLRASRQSIAACNLDRATPADLAAGLRRIYKQGRAAGEKARRHPRPELLHEWRKKAKLLVYGLELIEGLEPANLAKLNAGVNELTEVLGDDHDLFMVLQALRQEHRSLPARDFRPLAKRISVKRAKLEKHAFKIGARVYREKPGHFGEWLDHFLRHAARKRPKS
jgi:CHAD domain-containing protein